ncbi:unnamed protein product, partial [Adineta steineri]
KTFIMNQNQIGSEPVTSNSQQTSTDRSTLLSKCFVKKKFLWIIIGIIIVILVVTIPTVVITTKTTNVIKPSTVTAETTDVTELSTIETTDDPTTEVETEPKCDKWRQHGITIAGGHGDGDESNQLNVPSGIYIDDSNTILIADSLNHRTVEWKYNSNSGQVVAGGNGQGDKLDQLNWPLNVIVDKEKNAMIICDFGNKRVVRWSRQSQTNPQVLISNIACNSVTIDRNGYMYVSDWMKLEVRRWKEGDTHGILVAGGNGSGYQQNQLNNPGDIFVDEDYSVYVADINNGRIMKWTKDAKEGIVVAGGNNLGNGLNQLVDPTGMTVGDSEGEIVAGGNGEGNEPNQLNSPRGVSLDVEGNLYVVDSRNHRIQKYELCTE